MSGTSGQMLSHYRLVEKIGEGGMGVVWKAEDTVLQRTVAIKVLPAEVSRNAERRELFLQEAQLASRVSDAHIVQVHEFGHEGDLDFIVMEYVEGKPLNRLLQGRPLPPEKVAEIGLQLAKALSRAHHKNLLHRDLKPANILVTPDGDVKIVDFGLALLFERGETTAPSTRCSVTQMSGDGRLAGTLAYMSPEQARTEPLDARSDVFSLGTILYEMTTGQLPFPGPTNMAVLEAIRKARPEPVHELVPNVPLELDRIIRKAMAPRRGDRFQDVEDLAVDLKRLGQELESGSSPSYDSLQEMAVGRFPRRAVAAGIGFVVVAVALVAVWWFALGPGAALAPGTILIAPFEVRAEEQGGEYAGQALAEGIAINVARARDLSVLPVPPAAEFDRSTALERARESAAGLLLTGSMVREGGSVEVKLSLIDVSGNRIRWGLQREVPDGDLGLLASRAADAILKELDAEIPALYDYAMNLSGSPEMASSPLLSAVHGTLQRREMDEYDEASRRLAAAFPDQLDAHVLRGVALMDRLAIGRTEENRNALSANVAVMERLDPDNPYAALQRAFALKLEGRGRQALELYTITLGRSDLTPTMRAWVLRQRAGSLSRLGEAEAAFDDFRESLQLDPTNDATYDLLSRALSRAGRHDEAIEKARQAVALRPGFFSYDALAHVLRRCERWEESIAYSRQACEISQRQSPCADHAMALFRADRREEALRAAGESASMQDSPSGTYKIARVFALAGDDRQSLTLLRRAVASGYSSRGIFTESDLASFEDLAGFEKLVDEVKRRRLARARNGAEAKPESWSAQGNLGQALDDLERWDEAALAWGTACRLAREQAVCAAGAVALYRAGRAESARKAAEAAASLDSTSHGAYELGCYWALAGERARAIESLRRAVDLGYSGDRITRDPRVDSLRGEPAFAGIVADVEE